MVLVPGSHQKNYTSGNSFCPFLLLNNQSPMSTNTWAKFAALRTLVILVSSSGLDDSSQNIPTESRNLSQNCTLLLETTLGHSNWPCHSKQHLAAPTALCCSKPLLMLFVVPHCVRRSLVFCPGRDSPVWKHPGTVHRQQCEHWGPGWWFLGSTMRRTRQK